MALDRAIKAARHRGGAWSVYLFDETRWQMTALYIVGLDAGIGRCPCVRTTGEWAMVVGGLVFAG